MKARRKEIVESMRCWGFARGFNKLTKSQKIHISTILSKYVKKKIKKWAKDGQ